MLRQAKSIIFLLSISLLFLLFPLPQAAAAGGVRNTTKGLSYDTILEAVNAADYGDTIEVAAGTYAETDTIVIDKPLTLRGAAGAVIDGGAQYTISVVSPGVTLEGLTFTCASTDYSAIVFVDFDADSFVNATTPRSFSVLNCTLEGNDSTYSAIRLNGTINNAEITIRGNTIRNFEGYGFQSDDAADFIDSTVKIEANLFENAGWYGIDLDIPASGTDIFVTGNTVTAEDDAIYLDEILEGSSVTIKDNTLFSPYESIYFSDEIDGSTVIIEGNNIASEGEGIYFTWSIDGSTVIVKENNVTSNEYNGIYFDDLISESTLSFNGNTFLAENDCSLYCEGALFKSSVTFTDNMITARDGVHFYYLEESDLTMEGNEITAVDYGFYIYGHVNSTAILKNNSFIMQPDESSDGYALCIDSRSNSEFSLLGNLFTGALTGVYIYDESTGSEDDVSEITIAGNLFKENETGIRLYWADQTVPTIAFNAFVGNAVDIVEVDREGIQIPVMLNWWGSATGPAGLGEQFAFDPWLAALIINPDQAAGVEGESCTITAKLQDSNSALAGTSLLAVRFTVTGAHDLTQTVPLVNGMATLQYTGNPAGVDAITAEVLFAGEAAGLGGQTQRTWEAKPVTPPEEPVKPLPPTSGQADSRPWLGVLLLLTAVETLLYRRHTAAAR
jgi:nitrous oxidase accessory protein NosD